MLKLITVSNTNAAATNAPAKTGSTLRAKAIGSIRVPAKRRSAWKRFGIYDVAVLALTISTIVGCLAAIGNMGF